jgi:hypothetical protein
MTPPGAGGPGAPYFLTARRNQCAREALANAGLETPIAHKLKAMLLAAPA